MATKMLHVCVNVVGEHGELDESLAEPYKQEFEDISDVLEQAGFKRFHEPQAIIPWAEADDKRRYHERIPVHSLHMLRRAYAAMKAVRISGDCSGVVVSKRSCACARSFANFCADFSACFVQLHLRPNSGSTPARLATNCRHRWCNTERC